MKQSKWRMLILVTIVLFVLSNTLLVIASVSTQRIEAGQVTLLGVVDVLTALFVMILSILIYGKGFNLVTLPIWKNSHALITFLPAFVLVVIWLSLGKIAWLDVLLPGLAWRIYVLIQTIPPAIALWGNGAESTLQGENHVPQH